MSEPCSSSNAAVEADEARTDFVSLRWCAALPGTWSPAVRYSDITVRSDGHATSKPNVDLVCRNTCLRRRRGPRHNGRERRGATRNDRHTVATIAVAAVAKFGGGHTAVACGYASSCKAADYIAAACDIAIAYASSARISITNPVVTFDCAFTSGSAPATDVFGTDTGCTSSTIGTFAADNPGAAADANATAADPRAATADPNAFAADLDAAADHHAKPTELSYTEFRHRIAYPNHDYGSTSRPRCWYDGQKT